jgi:hypothetical protein
MKLRAGTWSAINAVVVIAGNETAAVIHSVCPSAA